jgi:hypothetical protein
MVVMFYGWLDIVRNIFEITYVSSKIGPLKLNLDGNQEKKFTIFDIRWCKNTVISNIDA